MSARRQRMERRVLLAPDVVSRAAAGRVAGREERWMLRQPRATRASYVAEVLDQPGDAELRRQSWMLRQPEPVRESYIREVLEPLLEDSGPRTAPT